MGKKDKKRKSGNGPQRNVRAKLEQEITKVSSLKSDENGRDLMKSEASSSGEVQSGVDFEDLHDCFGTFFKAAGLRSPTPIQAACWPAIEKEHRDVLGLAQTGSGKTLAYLLPGLSHILRKWGLETKKKLDSRIPSVLILVPARELALQVFKNASKFEKMFGVRSVPVYGGKDRGLQVDKLKTEGGTELVIGTPGRVMDLFGTKDLAFDNVSMLILDECDRMLDLGFEQSISDIIKQLPSARQNVLLSATFSNRLRKVIKNLKLLEKDPITIQVNMDKNCNITAGVPKSEDFGEKQTTSAVSSTITQIVQVCAEHKKQRKLLRFLEKTYNEEKARNQRNLSRVLVFCTKIKTVKFVHNFLKEKEYKVTCLHGSLTQREREQALKDFKAGKVTILVATDVAGRGIDIKNLPFVVNYDFPPSLEVYCHRIGRTGRQDKPGTAFSFFTRNLATMAPDLVKLLQTCNQNIDSYLLQLLPKPTEGEVEQQQQEEN